MEKHQKLRKSTQLRNPPLLREEFLLPCGRGRADTRWDRPRFFSANREDGQGPPRLPPPPEPQGPRRNPAGLTRGAGSLDHTVPNVLPVISLWVGPTWDPQGSKCRRHSARMGSGGRICEKPAGSLRGGTDRQGRFTPNPYAATKPPSPGVRTCPLGCVREEGEGKHSRRACLCTCVPYSVCMCASSRTHLYLYRVCVHD